MRHKKDVVAVVLAGGKGTRLKDLTNNVAKPAVDFGGKYKLIDFVLSNCSNSEIDTVGVITQYEPLELSAYIGIGRAWDLDVGNGGVHVLSPYTSKDNNGILWQRGTANAVMQHWGYIQLYEPSHVLILSSDHIYKMNYQKLIDFHELHDADLTISTIKVSPNEASEFGIIELDDEGNVVGFEEKPDVPKSDLASMGIYVFKTESLKLILENSEFKTKMDDFGQNVIPAFVSSDKKVVGYEFTGYWRDVGTVNAYWKANMELVDRENVFQYLDKEWPIYTKQKNSVPQYIDVNADVTDSVINEGSYINGKVIHSVISTECVIKNGAYVKDSVLLPNVVVGENCKIENAVISKNLNIPDNTVIKGSSEKIVLISSESMKDITKEEK